MDENNLEITNMETMGCTPCFPTSQYLPIVGGAVAGLVGGALLYRFVISPLVAKAKEKKAAANAKVINDEAKEEEKKDEEKS